MSTVEFKGGLVCAMGVSNLGQAMDWYQDVLGFTQVYRMDEFGWAEVQTPWDGVTIGLSQVEALQVEGGITPTFGVADVGAARKSLEEKGVKFDGPTQTIEGVVSLATFFDPDGNKLMFAQSLEEG